MNDVKLIKCVLTETDIEVADLTGESDYVNQCDTYAEASAVVAECADSENARHPLDWPLPRERAHQDALWFCSGGDQLL